MMIAFKKFVDWIDNYPLDQLEEEERFLEEEDLGIRPRKPRGFRRRGAPATANLGREAATAAEELRGEGATAG